jgi:hypothetical protein
VARFMKDPDAVLDYKIDWSHWLPEGDTIAASSWDAESGLVVDSNTFDDTSTTVWLSGGTTGADYAVTNHITTTDGREDDRTITIVMKEQ